MRFRSLFGIPGSAICLFLTLTLSSGTAAAEKIVIGTMNWAYMQVMSNVLKLLIEENYGEEVEFVPGKHAMFFKGMDSGKGEVDIFPDLWLPNNQGMADEYVTGRGTVAITQGTFSGGDALCTTKHTRDSLGLNTIYDLAKPEVVEAIIVLMALYGEIQPRKSISISTIFEVGIRFRPCKLKRTKENVQTHMMSSEH